MSEVTSKNMYALLGNDHEYDSDKEPEPPTKAIDKPLPRSTKRDVPDAAPARAERAERGGRGGRRGGFSGSDGAYRERGAGVGSNRSRPTDDGLRDDRHPAHTDKGDNYDRGNRSDRGRRGGRVRDERHSRGLPHDHVKQADQSWGAPTGFAEWTDERVGQAIATEEAKEGFDTNVPPPVDADGNPLPAEGEGAPTAPAQPEPEPEPEDNSKSYAEYLAEQAQKKLSLGGVLEARKPNEGSKQDKKWAAAKPLSKDDDEDAYIAGSGGKAKRERERERKEKQTVDIDLRYVEPSGGRGRGRGRGEFRGGERGGRGGGRGRGEYRGGGYRGDRGDRGERGERGGRGGHGWAEGVNVSDESAFPSLSQS